MLESIGCSVSSKVKRVIDQTLTARCLICSLINQARVGPNFQQRAAVFENLIVMFWTKPAVSWQWVQENQQETRNRFMVRYVSLFPKKVWFPVDVP